MTTFVRILSWAWCFGVGWLLGYLAAVRPEETSISTIIAMAFWCTGLILAWATQDSPHEKKSDND